jgi:phosphoglycolate phosphatase-like HAD superfamily hydrolase
MKYKTIVFDLDGTLVDSSRTILTGFNYALEPFGIQVSRDQVEVMRSMTSQDLFRDFLSECDAKMAVERLCDYSLQAATDTRLFPGIKTLIDTLVYKNVTLGLWTGRDQPSALKILQTHNLDQYFKVMVGVCGVKKNKPDPEGLHLIASTLNVPIETLLHIGDHEHDLFGAKAAGAVAVHAQWCPLGKSNPHFTTPDFSFATIEDFTLWLNQVL